MIYREVRLPAETMRAAFCAWRFELEEHDPPLLEHTVPPDGTVNLVLIRAPGGEEFVSVVGASLVAQQVPVAIGWSYCGIRLRPEAAGAVLGALPAPGERLLMTRGGSQEPVWRDLAAMLNGKEDWSETSRHLSAARPDDVIASAVDWIVASGGGASLDQLALTAGLSERQFRRRFVAATGIAPKFYADVQRVRRALILSLEDPDWAGVAAEAGFADQPHLTRDVKGRFGAAPGQIAGYFRGIRHELVTHGYVRFVQDEEADAA